jgi:two-component system alkaline phosphatase synthesis response regulator PhoP
MDKHRAPSILVIEDEESLVHIMDFTLTSRGYTVTAGRDGEEGLRKAREIHPDLIVLDVMLPLMDGFEVCRRLKEDPATRRIPVILLTAKAFGTDRAEGLAAGADLFVPKPFDRDRLLKHIAALLETSRGRGEAAA